MTTTERDWTRDDPYAGQELPAPPAWLPDAGEAVRAPVGETVAARGAAAAAVSPTVASSPAPPAPDLTKRQPETPASEPPGPPSEPPVEPPEDETDSEAETDSWGYVPLGISNAEGAEPPAEPHYVNPEIIEPPLTVAEPPDAAPGLPGQHWFDEGPKERPWHLIAMAGSLVLLIIVIAVIFVAGGDGGKGSSTAQSPPASALPPQAMPTEAVAARPVPAEELDALRPQAVAVGVFDGQLQVTWDPPRSPGTV
ncbi:MAG TPA: hypothetical protein VLH10_25510, partial [Yinghuangia sp.]|nr:hypothetical protein [Yinghuangia sp.]